MYKPCTRNEVNLGDYMPSYKPLVRLARFASQPTRISCEYAANLALAIRETRKTRVSTTKQYLVYILTTLSKNKACATGFALTTRERYCCV